MSKYHIPKQCHSHRRVIRSIGDLPEIRCSRQSQVDRRFNLDPTTPN